jgi:protein-S-isoprenylcysteine O-methyltransferase Ste14
MRNLFFMTFGIAGYLAGTAGLLALIVFLSGWLPRFSVDAGPAEDPAEALLIDAGLFLIWTVQHIGMARAGFKRSLQRWVPAALERANYMLFTGIALGLLLHLWIPIPYTLFEITHPVGVAVISFLFGAGWVFALAGIFYDSYLEFVGLKQVYSHVRGIPFETGDFKTGFVFRLCRRPTFFGILVGCWATPHMTAGHLLFAAAITLFTLTGCIFVERSYAQRYGDAYRAYQASTPLLIPRVGVLWRGKGRLGRLA